MICLQEVDRHFGPRSENVDQALLLARALDMQLAWGRRSTSRGPAVGRRGEYGNALLSRLPILISDVHQLPGGGEPRCALRTMIELDGGALWVTATHLRPDSRTGPRRWPRWPTCTPARWRPASSWATSTPRRTPPSSRRCASGSATPGSWRASATTAPGWRFWQHDEGHTHPARSPHRRIDQVWVTEGVDVASAQVLDGARRADHLPLRGRPGGPLRRLGQADAQAVSSSRSRWLITPVMPSPRMLTP